MNPSVRTKLVRIRSFVFALLLLGLIAFVPSVACACLETYRFSPVRMVIAAQLLGLLLVAFIASTNRAGWVTLGGFVLAGSWFAAMLTAGFTKSLVAAGAVVIVPIYLLALVAWSRVKAARRWAQDGGLEDAV